MRLSRCDLIVRASVAFLALLGGAILPSTAAQAQHPPQTPILAAGEGTFVQHGAVPQADTSVCYGFQVPAGRHVSMAVTEVEGLHIGIDVSAAGADWDYLGLQLSFTNANPREAYRKAMTDTEAKSFRACLHSNWAGQGTAPPFTLWVSIW